MDGEKLVEAVRTFDCLWKVSAKVYRDLFCLLRSASSSNSCSSSSVPFSITARVGEGGASREYRLLWIDVRRTGTLYCEQRYASVGVAQRHARTPRWLERRIVNPPLCSGRTGALRIKARDIVMAGLNARGLQSKLLITPLSE